MSFRADEKAKEGLDEAMHYLVSRIPHPDRNKSESKLFDLIEAHGPVVQSYPSWHPIVASFGKAGPNDSPKTYPSPDSGYQGLDHTVLLRHAFITCPYSGGEIIFESVEKINSYILSQNERGHKSASEISRAIAWQEPIATLSAERIDVPFYMPNATPILVSCNWSRKFRMEYDGTIPKSIAVPLLLETEVPCWRWAEVAETWENMRHYILGAPRGSRSSLFVNQETGQTLKTIWNSLIYTGMFGDIKVRR